MNVGENLIMSTDLVNGFDARITKRARLPSSVLVAYPIAVVCFHYLLYLLQQGTPLVDAVSATQSDIVTLVSPFAVLPVIVFAFFRELQLHHYLEKLLGTRRRVENNIIRLMSELADRSGYEHPSRIIAQRSKAVDWFYSYINDAGVTRARAFEIWEGYYVSLYLSAASALSIGLCILLVAMVDWWAIAPYIILPLAVFLLLWAHRRFKLIPKILNVPEQQIADVVETPAVLAEARRRFG